MRNKISELLKDNAPRIIGQDKYMNAAVLIALTEMEGKTYVVLEKRALEIRQGGEISFPGGRCDEKDRDSEETAVRETVEELGIPKEKIEITGKFGTLINASGMLLEVYIGWLKLESQKELNYNRDEVERVIFVPLEFFMLNQPRIEKIGIENIPKFSSKELGLPERYHKAWAGNSREVYFYNFQGDVIWGMTADILLDFIKVLKKNMEVRK